MRSVKLYTIMSDGKTVRAVGTATEFADGSGWMFRHAGNGRRNSRRKWPTMEECIRQNYRVDPNAVLVTHAP